jgi:inhibitor of KinA sporulation pathway (predicted exonuclease)
LEGTGGREKLRYIVFDLEWNQSADGKAGEVDGLPFEIIEIGAVRLSENLTPEGEFSRIIRPEVYKRLHFKVLEIMHVGMEELKKKGTPFPEVMREFLAWCREGEEDCEIRPVFCTWGSMDLTELQRNMAYYGMEDVFPYPLLYYDVQKLYHLTEETRGKDRPPLDKAVEALGIRREHPFHRALDDARYTGLVMQRMGFEPLKPYLSVDYYRLPKDSSEEIYLVFPEYSKYVSRSFPGKEEAMEDKTVTDLLCFRCGRLLRKKIRWFTSNQRYYYSLACCPEHGHLRGKIRIKHQPDDSVYVIKTIKFVEEDAIQRLMEKKEEVLGKRRRRRRRKGSGRD